MFDPFTAFHPIRRHRDNPACSHLRELIDSVVSVLEDMQNHYITMMERHMSAIVDKLLGAVNDLGAKVAEHDAAVQAAVAKLKEAQDAGDAAGIQTAIDAITAASTKVADETKGITDSMAAAVSAPAAPEPPAAATDAAPAADPAASQG